MGIPFDWVFIKKNTTDNEVNTSEDGGSWGTLTSLRLAVKCCAKIKEKLKPYKAENWVETVRAAVADGVVLQETYGEKNQTNEDGTARFESVKHVVLNRKLFIVNSSFYMYGASFAKVEVDLLSGEHKVVVLHQTFDIGDPINLGIELGQIEGGCIMGLGHYQREDMKWNEDGKLLTRGGSYTVPMAGDLPERWHISFNKSGFKNAYKIFNQIYSEIKLI